MPGGAAEQVRPRQEGGEVAEGRARLPRGAGLRCRSELARGPASAGSPASGSLPLTGALRPARAGSHTNKDASIYSPLSVDF